MKFGLLDVAPSPLVGEGWGEGAMDMANEKARQLRQNQTNAEKILWRKLRHLKSSGFHFRRQAPIGNFIAHFTCHSANLIIECDGGQHAHEEAITKDTARTAWLETQSYKVLRFWNNDVLTNIDGVMQIIHIELGIE